MTRTRPRLIAHDVLRLQIAVNDALAVRRFRARQICRMMSTASSGVSFFSRYSRLRKSSPSTNSIVMNLMPSASPRS